MTTRLRPFSVEGRPYLYHTGGNSLLALDSVSQAIIDCHLQQGGSDPGAIRRALAGRFPEAALAGALEELREEGIWGPSVEGPPPPSRALPLSTLVLHVAQTCNLACGYCYADGGHYGGPSKMVSVEVADRALDFLLANGADKVHVTFFGGEPLINWPVMRHVIERGERRAAEVGKQIDFSFTTNATLLSEEQVDFLASHRVGVSVSLDGPPDIHDANRPRVGGGGSYERAAERVAMLLERHTTRPIGARVTLQHGRAQVSRIFDHLLQMGFSEIGFSPVTSPDASIFLDREEMELVLADLRALGERTLQHALNDTYLGFSNGINLWQEIHAGRCKTYACGAGLGLLSVGVAGDLYLCHRFNGNPDFRFGDLNSGTDWQRLQPFLERVHVEAKVSCRSCWVKHLCGGGCYAEALVRQGDATSYNAHYCSFVRDWIESALVTYTRLWEANPEFLDKLAPRRARQALWPGGNE